MQNMTQLKINLCSFDIFQRIPILKYRLFSDHTLYIEQSIKTSKSSFLTTVNPSIQWLQPRSQLKSYCFESDQIGFSGLLEFQEVFSTLGIKNFPCLKLSLAIQKSYISVSKLNSRPNKPERVFGLQVRCRELDIVKIRKFLRNCLEIFGFFQDFFRNCF